MCSVSCATGELVLRNKNGIHRVGISQILYIEVSGHHLLYHTLDGEIDVCGSLRQLQEELADKNFLRCDHSYLVNLEHVSYVGVNYCIVDGEIVQISRRRKKCFVDNLVALNKVNSVEK